MKTHKMYLLLEIDTSEPENAVGTYPAIGGHHLVNRLKMVTADGSGMHERLMIKVLAAQNLGEQVMHYSGGEMHGRIVMVRGGQMVIDIV